MEWINVNDRLPSEDGFYLVHSSDVRDFESADVSPYIVTFFDLIDASFESYEDAEHWAELTNPLD